MRNRKGIDKFILGAFVLSLAMSVGIVYLYSDPVEKEVQLAAGKLSSSGYSEEATEEIADDTAEAAAEAVVSEAAIQTETEDETVRTRQWNVFDIPVDTSGVEFEFSYTNDPFKKISVSFHSIPSPMTEKEFEALQAYAEKFLGTPYVPGGSSPSEGFDCSGYVLYVLSHCGKELLGRSCEAQLESCCEVTESQLRPGDLIFFKGTQNRDSVSHVGIYLGDDTMIHAGMAGIVKVSLNEGYWQEHFYCYARPLR